MKLLTFWIGLGGAVNGQRLTAWFAEQFPDALASSDEDTWERGGHAPIVWALQPRPGAMDFPLVLELLMFPGAEAELPAVRVTLARLLAAAFEVETLVDAEGFPLAAGVTTWALVFRGTEAWVALDAPSDFYDGDGGAIALVRTVAVPELGFDSAARLC